MVSNNDKRLIQVAMNGWRQFFHYFWRGKWKTAWKFLSESRAQVKEMQQRYIKCICAGDSINTACKKHGYGT